ncbi:MAG TPA: magnesium transporter [Thermoanaerobaculia bacterium]|nr:magnesium transporter [Thermoanaerobaculia bacterium]
MTRPALSSASTAARSYQQVMTKLLRHNALSQLRKIIDKTLSADIAPVIPLLLLEDRQRIFALLIEAGKAARVILELERDQVIDILKDLDDATVASICNSSAPDDAADLLDLLDDERRAGILSRLDPSRGAKLQSLLVQEKETAGSLMTTEFLALDENLTVANAITAIRQYPRKDSFFYVYTVDTEGRLLGVLSLRHLILAEPDAKLSSIMVQHVVRTSVDSSQEEVAQVVAKYDLLSVPVVDMQNRLVGVVTVDDVIDVIQEEAEEDLLHLAGVDVSERLSTPVGKTFKARFPWLIVNLATAFVAASVIRYFEGTIERWAVLAAFMPVVVGIAGNAGTQTLTVFVRALAFGEVEWGTRGRPIFKELLVGLANGLGMGVLTATIVGLWTGDFKLALILFGAMTFTMIVAGVAGGFTPLILKRFGFDPAVSSSIFVTAVTDVAGFFAFLGLATLVLLYWRF